MSIMKSKFKYMYDAAPEAALLDKADAAHVATFNGAEFPLDQIIGYWNTQGELADQTFAIVVNVPAVAIGASKATMTFLAVIATDTFTLNDTVQTATFIAGTDFAVGADDTITAANAAAAINASHLAGHTAFTAISALGVVTLTNVNGPGGSITEAEATITTTAFAGGNETYKLDLQGGPVGFASNAVLGTIASIRKPGQYVILLDVDTAKAVKSDLAAIRLVGTLTGTAPSITAYSWIAGILK